MNKELLEFRNLRVGIICVFIFIALLGIIELLRFGISPPIEMIKMVLQGYLTITYIYAFILSLLYIFYFSMGGRVEKEKGVLSMYGPSVYTILSIMVYSSVFYMALVLLFHIFKGTFSAEFQLHELMILGAIMAYLAFHCIYDPLLDKGRHVFKKKAVKSRR